MDVKNSSGRVVSLLNSSTDDDTTSKSQSHRYNHHHHHQHQPRYHSQEAFYSKPRQYSHPLITNQSRRSSSNSIPALSPNTPALSRSDSDDSRAGQSPSPITPTLAYETEYARYQPRSKSISEVTYSVAPPPRPTIVHQSSGYQQQQQYDPYPLTPATAMGELSLQRSVAPKQQTDFFKPAVYEPATAAYNHQQGPPPTSQMAAKPAAPKKNSYPCPVARQYGCNEYFTTSGHAARHAKKHTGRKDAICPECSKAFTRKDNMEQHRRTHSGVRGAPRSVASMEDAKAKKMKLQQKKTRSPSISNPSVELAMLDPRLMDSPSSTASYPPAQRSPTSPQFHQLPPPQASQHIPSSPESHARPQLQRSMAKDALHWRLDPAPATFGGPASPYAASSPYSYASPASAASALDALALAASRQ